MRTYLKVLKAAADGNRLKILKLLQYRELCVCELQCVLGISQPAISRHLRVLAEADLVRSQKDRMWNNFRLAAPDECNVYSRVVLVHVRDWLEDDPQIQGILKRAQIVDRLTSGGASKLAPRVAS